MASLRKVHINEMVWKYKISGSNLYVYDPRKSKGTQPTWIGHSYRSMDGAITPEDVKLNIHIFILKDKPMPNLINQRSSGLYDKFNVDRRDGRDRKYGDRLNADYFVLDLTYDKFAKIALEAYIKACEAEYPQLAADLRLKLK